MEDITSIGDGTEEGIYGYESGGQEGRTVGGGGEDELGVNLASLLESEASLKKSIEGINEFVVNVVGDRTSEFWV